MKKNRNIFVQQLVTMSMTSVIFLIFGQLLCLIVFSFFSVKKVCVGGSKPGRIEFLGETKFAPGEWAGVVLDEPVGKNDGSVGGVSYFKVSRKPRFLEILSEMI